MSYYGDKLRVLRAGYASPTARGLLDVRDEDEERRNSFERTARQRVPAGQAPKMPGPKPSSNSLADRADERSILQKTGDVALDGVGALGNLLDVPGSVFRDVLTFLPGGPAPANPLDQLLPWNWTKSRGRTTGQDFMEDYGLMDQNTNPFVKFAGGLAFEVATDPVTYLSGGLSSVIKGGGKGAIAARALKKQGILDRVDTYVKSGVGKREALQTSSTRDVIKSEPLVKAARTTEEADAIRRATESSIDNAIRADKSFKKQAANLTKEKADELVEEIKDSKLADSYYRFKAPGLPEVKFGGTKRARFQDELGKKVRYSGPVVSAMSKVSKRNENLTTAQSQIAAREFAPELEGATALARSKMYPNIKELDSILNDFDGLTGEDFINAQNEVGMQMSKYMEDISRERVPGVDLETGLDLTDEAGMSIPKMVFEESRDELFKESRDEFRERFLNELAESVTDPSKPNVTEAVYNKVAQALAPRQGGPPVMTLGTDGVAREAPGMSSSILDDIKDQMDELAVSAKQYGDFTSLTDEFATYSPRLRQTSRGTISSADRSKAFDPENPFALKRDDKYRGIPGGTSAINRMSIDQRFAGITSKKALNATKQNSDEYMNKFSLFKREYASDLAGAKEGKAKDLFDAIASRDLDDVKRGVTLFSVDPGGSALRAMESAYRTRVQADMIRDAVRQVMDVESVPSGRMSTSVRTLGGAFTDELAEETASVVGMAESLGSKLAAARGVPEESVSKKFRFEGPDDLGSGPRDPVPTEPSSSGPNPTGRTPDQQPTQPGKQVDTDVTQQQPASGRGGDQPVTQQQPASGRGGDQPVTNLETSQTSVDARDPLWGLINEDLGTLLKGITSRTKEEFIQEAVQLGRENLKLLTKQVSPEIKVSGAGRTASVLAGDVYDTATGILSGTKKAPVEETGKVPVGAIDPASLMESLDPNQELLFRVTGFLKSNVDPKSPFLIRIPDSMMSDLTDAGFINAKPIEVAVVKSQQDEIARFVREHAEQRPNKPAEFVRDEATSDNLYILRDGVATVSVPSYFVDTVKSLHGDNVQFYVTRGSLGNRGKRVFALGGEEGSDMIASASVKPVRSAEEAYGSTRPRKAKQPVVKKEVDLFDGDKILQSAFDDHRRFVDSLPPGIQESSRAEMIGVRDLHKYPVQLRDQAVRYLAENKPEYLDALKKKLNKTNDDKSLQLLESIKRATSAPDGSALKTVSAKVRVDAPNRSRVMFGLSRVFGDEEAATTLAVFDATAKAYARATKRSADEFYASIDNIAEVSSLGANAPDNARGSIIFHKNGQASIFGSKSADISTSIHEMTHYARRILADVDSEFARLVDAAVGSNAGRLSVEQEELFARGFETFLSEGKAPVPELDSIYAKIKQWITDVYKGLKGTPLEEKITPELRSAYQRMQGVVDEVPTKPNAKKGKGVVDKSSPKKSGKGRSKKKAPNKYSRRHQKIADAIGVDASSLSKRQLKDIELVLEDASQILDEQINPDSILINLFGGRQIEVKDTSNNQRVRQAYDISRENVTKAVIKAHEMNEQGLDYSNWKGFDEIADLAYSESGEAGYFIAKDGTYDIDQLDNAEKLWNLLLSKEIKKKKSGNRYISLNPSKKLSIYDERVVAMAEEMGRINPILEPPTYNQPVKRKPSPWDDPFSFGEELERFDPETGEELFQSSRGRVEENAVNEAGEAVLSASMPGRRFMEHEGDVVIRALQQPTPDDFARVIGKVYSDHILDIAPQLEDQAKSLYGVRNGDWGTIHSRDGVSKTSREWLAEDFVKFARGEIKPPSGLGGYFDGMLQVVMKMIGRDGAVPVNNQIGKFLGQIMDQPFRGEVTSMAEVMRKLGDRNPTAKSRLLALFTPEEQTQAVRNALRKRVETRQARLRNGGLDELERQIEEIKIEAASMPGDEDAIKEFEALVRRKEREVKQATDLLGKTPDQWLDEYETLRMSGEKNSLDGVRFDVTDSAKVGEAKIPSWMANDLIKQNEVADQVEGLFGIGAIDEWWDKYSSVFKTSVTALHPGFHLRNFTSGFAHNAMNGVHDPRYSAYNVKRFTQPYTDGRQLMYGKQVAESNKIPGLEEMTDAQASEQLAEELFVHGVIEQPGSYRDIPGEKGASVYSQLIGPRDPSQTPDNLFGFFKSRRSPLPKPMEGVQEKGVYRSLDRMKRAWSQASETGRSIGDIVEFQHRVGGYIALRRQGYSAAAAGERINMLHVDYSNLTSFEKQKLRRLVPFYSFSRGMAKYLANELTTNPAGPVGISIRAQNRTRDRDVATPTYVSKGLSVPLGTNEDGTRHFLTGLGLMHEQPVQQLAPLLSMDPGSALFSGISNLNPLAKIPLELAFDESTFQQGVDGGVDLDDARPPVGQMLSNLADNEDGQPVRLGKTFEVLAGSSPASRYIKTVSQMSDDRKGLFGRYVAPLTGFRVTSVSPERQDAVLRERAEQYLQDIGARKFEKRYIPDEVYNAMSEEDKKIVDKYLALIEVLGKRSKERRSNQKKGLVDG